MLLGVYQIPFGGVNNFCMKCVWGGHQIPLGGTSDTFGGDIRYLWGGHQIPRHPSRPQKRWCFLPLKLLKTYLKLLKTGFSCG